MNISDNGIDLIKKFEGFRAEKYQDVAGNWTIGYGHEIKSGEEFDDAITEEQATELLEEDASYAVDAVNQYVTVPLNQNQFDALVSFVYNIGEGAFAHCNGLAILNQGNYEGAIEHFEQFDHSGGVEVEGLEERRMAEAALWNTQA
jgi:lysozyme